MKTIIRVLCFGCLLASSGGLVLVRVEQCNAALVDPVASLARSATTQVNDLQKPAFPASESELPYRVARIGVEQGLSSSETWGVVRDDQGFIWIGTMDGLNRYDAYGMKVFKHDLSDPTSLSDNAIRSLYVDGAGNLWIGSWFNGLNRFDHETETFTRFQHDPDDPNSLSNNADQCHSGGP